MINDRYLHEHPLFQTSEKRSRDRDSLGDRGDPQVRHYLWETIEDESRHSRRLDSRRVRTLLHRRLAEVNAGNPDKAPLETPSLNAVRREVAAVGPAFVYTQPRPRRNGHRARPNAFDGTVRSPRRARGE